MFASSMTQTIRSEPSTTILVPHNDAFTSLGLLTSYLLLPEADARKALRSVLKHHVLKRVVYAERLGPKAVNEYKTVEGSKVIIQGLDVTASGTWNITSGLLPVDALTQTGVVHELRDVLLPSSLRVNIRDLARAAKGNTMVNLIERAGLGRLLNGTLTYRDIGDLDDWKRTHRREPKVGSLEWNISLPSPGWTLLCPTDSAFKRVNLTHLLDDLPALRRLVLQHIIPTPPPPSTLHFAQPLPFGDDATFTSLLSPDSLHADIIFRKIKGKKTILGIRGARGTDGETDYATVLDFGRTTAVVNGGLPGTRSGVVQIDRVLEPWVPGWWMAWGQAVIAGIGSGFGIIAFWGAVLYFWRRKKEEATYEPLDGEGTGEEEVDPTA